MTKEGIDMKISGIDGSSNVSQQVYYADNNIDKNIDNNMNNNAVNNQENTKTNTEKQYTNEDYSVTQKTLDKTMDKINKALNGAQKEMRYSVHKATNSITIKILDKDSGEVIREIPPEKILDLVAKMCEMSGILIDQRI
jgi:flagellar protein FlaG